MLHTANAPACRYAARSEIRSRRHCETSQGDNAAMYSPLREAAAWACVDCLAQWRPPAARALAGAAALGGGTVTESGRGVAERSAHAAVALNEVSVQSTGRAGAAPRVLHQAGQSTHMRGGSVSSTFA